VTIIFGFLFLLAGIAAGVRSGLLESRTAQGQHIELWSFSPGPSRTMRSVTWLVAGVLLAGTGSVLFTFTWGFPVNLLFLLPSLAALVVVVRHNHAVAKREPKA
jgi:hypothetical protein